MPMQDFFITDTMKTFDSDADAQQLRDGATLVVVSAHNPALAAPARERISFQPHPKTLTMAGEFEYFAAQVCCCAAVRLATQWVLAHVVIVPCCKG